jgi:phosphoribosylaminoimidazolecarboxamide formyltransferase/IMP cyclohydrolase
MSAIQQHNIAPIDVVVVNLYPFRQTVTAAQTPSYETAVENIDIGGPAMIRAAAKNHSHVTVVVDPSDYDELLQQLGNSASDDAGLEFRKRSAWKAFQHCATYDSTVAEWFWSQIGDGASPPEMSVPFRRAAGLRYGENPHQQAAFYTDASLAEAGQGGIATATQHHGKEMSYNNYLDGNAAYEAVCDFPEPTCVIVKHTNPCGVASRNDLLEAYRLAVRADPTSAFGGIVAFNRPVDEQLAAEIREFRSPSDGETRMFYEIVIAPGYTSEGLEKLKGKSKTLRILEAKPRAPSGRSLRQIAAGWLYQEADSLVPEQIEFTPVSDVKPTPEQLEDLKFAWRCVKHVKSNAITVAKGQKLLGMGSGQPNRVKSVQIALEKAADEVEGSVLASDAFFPFSWNDSVEIACKAGVKAIVHPGGSMRDQDAVDCCNKYGVALVTTGVRHFRH